jgi:hypothetical protein
MGQGGTRMKSGFEIELQRPVGLRRGSSKVVVIAYDLQGAEVFHDKIDLNEEKNRDKITKKIASLSGDESGDVNDHILALLGKMLPPNPIKPNPTSNDGDGLPYEETQAGILWNKETLDGIVPTPLTTFTARISAQVVEDDGVEIRRLLEIEATSRNRKFKFQVPSNQFTAMNWPMEHIGAGAALYPGFSVKDHARAAIQFMSGEPPERTVYTHLGWRRINETYYYLHAGGAIGPMGSAEGIEVSLPPDLQRYELPEPPVGDDLKRTIQASLGLLDVAGDAVTVPVYCALWRAVLGSCDSGIHLVGHTGAGKTELAALAQQHYGAEMHARRLPGSWLTTDNALEGQAFVIKDALFVVDDFCPTGSQYDIQAMHKKGDRLYRGQGNASGRGRMRSDGTLRPTKSPRGMVLGTGEDVPRGQSLRARLLVLEIPQSGNGAIDWAKLSQCQTDASAGLYSQAMAAYVRWLSPQYQDVQSELKAEIDLLRDLAHQSNQHKRTPGVVANLGVGLKKFLTFALESDVITKMELDALWERCWVALGDAAAAQQGHQANSDPVNRFLELLSASISGGRAHLTDVHGEAPKSAGSWGWREVTFGTGENQRTDWKPLGEHIGWMDGGDVFLQGDSAFAVVQKLARDSGDQIPVSLPTIKRRLHERCLLASTEKSMSGGREVERLDIRKTLQGRRRTVMHFNSASWASTPPERVPSAPNAPYQEHPRLEDGVYGAQNGAHTDRTLANVYQGSAPMADGSVPELNPEGTPGTLGAQIQGHGHASTRVKSSPQWQEPL